MGTMDIFIVSVHAWCHILIATSCWYLWETIATQGYTSTNWGLNNSLLVLVCTLRVTGNVFGTCLPELSLTCTMHSKFIMLQNCYGTYVIYLYSTNKSQTLKDSYCTLYQVEASLRIIVFSNKYLWCMWGIICSCVLRVLSVTAI